MRKIACIFILFVGSGCYPHGISKDVRQQSIEILEEAGYELGKSGDRITVIQARGLKVTDENVYRMCNIQELKKIYFIHSVLVQGAVARLANCLHLATITYENASTLPLEEIPDHDGIPNLDNIIFLGPDYGDAIMPYLARLSNV
ncbi:MAG: hypothetical protein GWN86_07535, partial [Desulfobacterales bacterium]|nr:hypothetical protein [Desulfobacterales bacterium]